ncbi:hypothetical protein [Sulfuracidifex metallicus]|uniref:Uncharacterized protein n=1 Tax=Sulfuracidifex metallicus DSM 6482 = JCM 9184 TaxID=523847 RepID=A0A6A9QKP8_SULME|nr:hypothetical protein [Sulfuracidifex metallicus]MUN29586.1 hypothetical protein [Sulfuracidifex metallicus DSM 6482 = JCM 9184]WOE49901.1 hypothetical protein RQ359_001393 [Sulfuracidifex metallicus DSM 6482 = JCM 9184]
MTTEGFRSLVYIVEIIFVFVFLYLFDILYIKNGIAYYGILALGVAVSLYLGYLLVKSVQKYFNY